MTERQQTAAAPAAATKDQDSEFDRLMGRKVSYTPQGESEPIDLSASLVRRYLVKPTKSGAMPSEADVIKFVMLCKARELNPWVGDAYLVGYDGREVPEFSLITSVHALHKRADRCPEYDGLTAGVIVKTADGVTHVDGTCYPDGAVLLGGWARARRKDRSEPFYYSVRLQARDKNRSTWNDDKPGMIRKCAIAGVLREAFPNQTSGLYTTDELPAMVAAASQSLTDGTPPSGLTEAARKAKEDLSKMLSRDVAPTAHEPPQSIGDAEAADAREHISEQTPTDEWTPRQEFEQALRNAKTESQAVVCANAAKEAGFDLDDLLREKLAAIKTKKAGRQQDLVK